MDPPSPTRRDLIQEEILENIIHNAPDADIAESPSSYLNPSGDGMEVDHRSEDEVHGSDDGEGDSSDDGEAGGPLTKSGEVDMKFGDQ
jgi:hypothetical protein